MINVCQYARVNNIPFLGIFCFCLVFYGGGGKI